MEREDVLQIFEVSGITRSAFWTIRSGRRSWVGGVLVPAFLSEQECEYKRNF